MLRTDSLNDPHSRSENDAHAPGAALRSNLPLTDVVQEAKRIASHAREAGLAMRLMGGVAVAVRCPSAGRPPLARPYGDIDFAIPSVERTRVERLMDRLGYQPNKEINLLFGKDRLIFFDPHNRRDIDILVGQLRMCHTIPFANDGFDVDHSTLTLACLLMTKLQVVETTDKDYRDITAILIDHPIGSGHPSAIDIEWITSLCARDWGLWRTVLDVGARTVEAAESFFPPLDGPYDLASQVALITDALSTAPKTMKWKTRSIIGRRVQWYEIPDRGEKTA